MHKNLATTIVAHKCVLAQSKARKPANQKSPLEARSPYLQIASIPWKERINTSEPRYCLIIQPQGLRIAGQFSAQESHAIANATKGWDWSSNSDGRPFCLLKLEALLDRICDRSARKGGDS